MVSRERHLRDTPDHIIIGIIENVLDRRKPIRWNKKYFALRKWVTVREIAEALTKANIKASLPTIKYRLDKLTMENKIIRDTLTGNTTYYAPLKRDNCLVTSHSFLIPAYVNQEREC